MTNGGQSKSKYSGRSHGRYQDIPVLPAPMVYLALQMLSSLFVRFLPTTSISPPSSPTLALQQATLSSSTPSRSSRMAPVVSRIIAFGSSENTQAAVVSQGNPGTVVLLALGAFAFLVLVAVVYLVVSLFWSPKANSNPRLRKLVLPGVVADKQRSNGVFGRLAMMFGGGSKVNNDLEAQVVCGETFVHKIAAVEAQVQVRSDDAHSETPSLCGSVGSSGSESSIPESWFDLDNLLATPTEELGVFNFVSEPSDNADISDKRLSIPPLAFIKRSSRLFGLGFDVDIVPTITVDDCETRSAPPEDVNFDAASPQSPISVSEDPSIDYLGVPSPQFSTGGRRRAERKETTHSWINSMSLNAATTAANSSPPLPGQPDPEEVAKTMALLASMFASPHSRAST
ncbi:hypothetical protein BXZ70DRAFT_77134 [Cristinia sonorae]|uniref:Uncharacterized protein n=1 Tax=Cristinia sonorae TaxID=1940300 RepID=A0A8K0USS2_9AGAR|nr:hypothetical protein BXZ70DRAFT_77134 [Cristinia sonorae]